LPIPSSPGSSKETRDLSGGSPETQGGFFPATSMTKHSSKEVAKEGSPPGRSQSPKTLRGESNFKKSSSCTNTSEFNFLAGMARSSLGPKANELLTGGLSDRLEAEISIASTDIHPAICSPRFHTSPSSPGQIVAVRVPSNSNRPHCTKARPPKSFNTGSSNSRNRWCQAVRRTTVNSLLQSKHGKEKSWIWCQHPGKTRRTVHSIKWTLRTHRRSMTPPNGK
jgi:hypothetical protein